MATVRDQIKIDANLEEVRSVLDGLLRGSSEEAEAPDNAERWQDVGESHLGLGQVNQPAQQKRICQRLYESDFLLESASARFSLESNSQWTVLRMDITYHVASPGFVLVGWGKRLRLSLGPLGQIMLLPTMGRLLLKAVRDTLAGIKVRVEEGETASSKIPVAAAPPVA